MAASQPYRYIYTSLGLTLHDIAMSLAKGQIVTTGDSDDMCTVCGEGGNLILCGNCPRAFHAACLGLRSLPEGDWCFSNWRERSAPGRKLIAGDSAPSKPIVIRLTRDKTIEISSVRAFIAMACSVFSSFCITLNFCEISSFDSGSCSGPTILVLTIERLCCVTNVKKSFM